jgi:DNA processing protein
MPLELNKFIFLSEYVPLPLSAIHVIENDESHPFYDIEQLDQREILRQLKLLNKMPNVSIRELKARAKSIEILLNKNIFKKIEHDINEWTYFGIKIVPFFDDEYPARLKVIQNPPKIIYVKGNFKYDYDKAISIIGTRNPSDYGAHMAKEIGNRFAKLGFTVVNGFAKGVDTAAFEGALDAGGSVIGVLGSGLLHPYPKENVEFFHEIAKNEKGCFISERMPDKPVMKTTLATSNRISSALSIGNVFIEGEKKSGIRWQLNFAKQQGKPIIVLMPKQDIEQAYIPNSIIKNEKEAFIIENINEVDHIAEAIIKLNEFKLKLDKKNQGPIQKSLDDF